MTRNRLLFASVAVLALNDFVLKARFPGVITGKLSDVAGLIAFVLFWRMLLPRHATTIGIVTSLGFAWWKSPLAQAAIDAWNSLGVMHVGRVVDATDLLCLAVVPLACAMPLRAPEQPRRWASVAIGVFSLLAFVATSRPHTFCCSGTYLLPDKTPAEAVARMRKLGLEYDDYPTGPMLIIRHSPCPGDHITAYVRLTEHARGTLLYVEYAMAHCRGANIEPDATEIFRREVLEPLGAQPAPSSRTND